MYYIYPVFWGVTVLGAEDGYESSHVEYESSHVEYESSHVEYESSHVEYESSHVEYESSHVEDEHPNFRHSDRAFVITHYALR